MVRKREQDIQDIPLLVLAGGFGVRLRELVGEVPKPLAPIGKVPFLALLLDEWKGQGCKKFIFLLHHQAEQIIQWLEQVKDTYLAGCTYAVVVESKPLGTGGAIANAIKVTNLSGNFLVANADTSLSGGLREVLNELAPAIGIVHVPEVARFGQVHFDDSHLVTAFSEKNKNATQGWINAGIYHLETSSFLRWDGNSFSIESDWFPEQVRNKNLHASKLTVNFIDIGIPEDYQKFCNASLMVDK